MDSSNWRVKRDAIPQDPQVQVNGGTGATTNPRLGAGNLGNASTDGCLDSQIKSNSSYRKPLDNAEAERAIREGRRLYVGNMPYQATVADIEELFADVASGIGAISMSVDPLTGRNPSYCFVDFSSSDVAQSVMDQFSGRIFMGRPLKVKPGVKSTASASRLDMAQKPAANQPFVNPLYQDRWKNVETTTKINMAGNEGRRLYVGGLPMFKDQFFCNTKVRELFKGFHVLLVGKLITPHKSKLDEPGNHHYCFVDLSTVNEAKEAVRRLDGMEAFGGNIQVRIAFGTSRKLSERQSLWVGGLSNFAEQEDLETAMMNLFRRYEVKSVSKIMSSADSKIAGGNSMYCFVELADGKQADAAVAELDGKVGWNGKIRVKPGIPSRASSSARYRGWGDA